MSPECRAALVRVFAEDPGFLERPAAEFLAPVLRVTCREEPPEACRDPAGLVALRKALAGRYAVEQELARGGMARVYRARDLRHGRPVALKVMKEDRHHPGAAGRFLREIRIAAGLTHPHILPLHDSGSSDGLRWLVMPLIEGESLRSRISRAGPLRVGEAIRILLHIAGALAYAHRRGIVHRDVKPENILLHEGHALLADFGIACRRARSRLEPGRAAGRSGGTAMTGAIPGTPAYMAPELATGNSPSDHRADLYALGLVGYEMLAGARPLVRKTREEPLAARLAEVRGPLGAVRSEVPGALSRLVERLLAKRPGDRPRDAERVVAELERIRPAGSSRTRRGAARSRCRERPRSPGAAPRGAGGSSR